MLKKTSFKKNNTRVGIVLRRSDIQYAMIRGYGTELEIIDTGEYPSEDPISALEKIKAKVSVTPCHFVLPHQEVMIKTFFFSGYFTAKEVGKLLYLNAEHYFSFSETQIYYDYEFLNKFQNKVRALASKKESINSWMQKFKRCGLVLNSISVDILALECFLNLCDVLEKEKVYGVFVSQGKEVLQVVVVDKLVVFINSISVSSGSVQFYVHEIQKFFRLYEGSKFFCNPISELIFFAFNETILAELTHKLLLPVVEVNQEKQSCVNAHFLLSIGAALTC